MTRSDCDIHIDQNGIEVSVTRPHIPAGSCWKDFLQVADHFSAPPPIRAVGEPIIRAVEGIVSKGDRRSMNSVRTAHYWAGGLFCFLTNWYGHSLPKRAPVATFLGLRVSTINKYERRIREIRDRNEQLFEACLGERRGIRAPSEMVESIIGKRFDAVTIAATRSLLQLVNGAVCGRRANSVIPAAVFLIEALRGRTGDTSALCALGGISAVTLKNNVDCLSGALGIFCLVGVRNKVFSPVREWLAVHYASLLPADDGYLYARAIQEMHPEDHIGNVILLDPVPAFWKVVEQVT